MNTTINKRKKVLLMVTKSNFGGAQRYVYDLATHLPSDKFDVTIAAGGNGMLFEKCRAQGIRTVSIPHLERDISLFKELKALWNLFKLFKKEQPDIIHLNSPKIGGIGGLSARLAGIKNIIYTNHGWSFHEDRSWLQKVLIKLFSWIIIVLSTSIIVLSEKEKNDVITWPFTKNKIKVVANGITPPEFLEKSEARKKLFEIGGIPDTNLPLILSIGELTKNKGYEYAFKALKEYSTPHTYLIAGTGELAETFPKEHLLGFVPDAAQYLKASDVFLLPSIKEGLPYVLLETGFAKVPVISTNVGGIADFAADQKDKLVAAKSSEALQKALENKQFFYPTESKLEDMVAKIIEVYNKPYVRR